VVARLDEHLLRSLEQLCPPGRARQPQSAAAGVRVSRHG
jgi:hypothetical protein